jgi:L-asparaginase
MEQLPHVLLVGDGAARFADECGFERVDLHTEEARAEWCAWIDRHVPPDLQACWPDVPLASWSRLSADPETAGGTVTYMAVDASGDVAAGVSTCGWARKYPGRLGDSPLAPAGAYADSRYGAAACTGQGELAIRAGTARAAAAYLKAGLSVDDACREAVSDLRALDRDFGGSMTVHVMDMSGRSSVRSIGLGRPTTFWIWAADQLEAVERQAISEQW